MKLILITLIAQTFAFANISIISDLDETIKRTHSKHAAGIYNGVFTRKVYKDIPLVIKEILKNEQVNDLHILSASPRMLKPNIKKLLKKYNLKYKSLILRNIIRQKSKFKYKYNAISRLLKSSKDSFILIGDNISDDPQIYTKIAEDYPGRIAGIYIHKVVDKEIIKNVDVYFTSFELALFNRDNLLVSPAFTQKIGLKLMTTKKMKNYFPKRVFCPSRLTEFNRLLTTEPTKLAEKITQKILSYCN